MPKICYVEKRFARKSLLIIQQANEIISEYEAEGFSLTLRQLYYRFVSKNIIPNNLKSYKKLGSIINDARLAGLIDWNSLEDRTRNLRGRPHWSSPADVIDSAARGYSKNLWEGIDKRCEVWIEKDALVGVIERVCTKWDVPFFSCRGYASQSEVWRAGERLIDHGVPVTVIHLGDHDPSGIDMTRDIENRLQIFGAEIDMRRIALNMNQVKKFRLPPNPAKSTDARFKHYVSEHGEKCWELDALDPKLIEKLIETEIEDVLDEDVEIFNDNRANQEIERSSLLSASEHWPKVEKLVRKLSK